MNETKYERCDECAATGKVECATCEGIGEVTCQECEGQGRFKIEPVICPAVWIDMHTEPWREQRCDREVTEQQFRAGLLSCPEHNRQRQWKAGMVLAPLEVRA